MLRSVGYFAVDGPASAINVERDRLPEGDGSQQAVNEGQGDAARTPLVSEAPSSEPDLQIKLRPPHTLCELPDDGLFALGTCAVEQLGDDRIDDDHSALFEQLDQPRAPR